MHAVVTTGNFVLLVDIDKRLVTPLEGPSPSYYGVSWFPRSPDLIVANSRMDPIKLRLGDYPASEVGGLSIGDRSSDPFLSFPHQIVCLSDGRIACTNTGRNCLTLFDPDRPNLVQEARISSARWDRLPDFPQLGDHLNSVFEKDGVLYVVAHGFQKGSALATFRLPDVALLQVEPTPGRTALHNIWVTESGQRISCHSQAGSVVDLAADKVLWEAGLPVYTRGLAATPDIVIVGESQIAPRGDRAVSSSGLWILDRRSWKAIDYFSLGPYGGVNEVRLLDVPDEAHHGHVFAGLDALLRRDVQSQSAQERVRLSTAAGIARECWADFTHVMGAVAFGERGERIAKPDTLAIAVHQAPQDSLAFHYQLVDSGPTAHVSAVLDYRGAGADTDMTALLLEPVDATFARLSVWRHDGGAWTRDADVQLSDLPRSGRVDVVRRAAGISLSIDGAPMLDLPADDGRAPAPFGIRWIGCSVRPVSAGQS